MSSSAKPYTKESTTNNPSAIVPANPPVQQQYPMLFGVLLVPNNKISREDIVEGEKNQDSYQKRGSQSISRPVKSELYASSFAVRGQSADPHSHAAEKNSNSGHTHVPPPVTFMPTSGYTSTEGYALMTPPCNLTSQRQDATPPRQIDGYQRLIIEPDGFGFNPRHETAKVLTAAIGKFFDAAYLTWKQIPQPIRQLIFNEFKEKCAWLPHHDKRIKANFESKARHRISDSFYKGRKRGKKPKWCTSSIWEDLCRQWSNRK